MAVTLSNAFRDASNDAGLALLNGGSLVLLTSGNVAVATMALSATAYAASSSGTAQENAISDDSNAAGGVVTKFELRSSGGTVHVSGTVTATSGGGDIEMTNTTVGAGQVVSVSDLSFTR